MLSRIVLNSAIKVVLNKTYSAKCYKEIELLNQFEKINIQPNKMITKVTLPPNYIESQYGHIGSIITTILDDTTALMVFKAALGKKLVVSVDMNLSLLDHETQTNELVFVSECQEINDIVAYANCDIYDGITKNKIASGRQILRVLDIKPPIALNFISQLSLYPKRA